MTQQTKLKIETGTKLPNGATVIHSHYVGDGSQFGEWIVLCHWRNETEYVTWKVDRFGNAFWGHYFPVSAYDGNDDAKQAAFNDATDDYRRICKQEV